MPLLVLHRIGGWCAAAALLTVGAAGIAGAQAPVRVMTFNIRYGTANDGEHSWPYRREHVVTVIRDHAPHLLGVQEALRGQLDELARALRGYRELGTGRDDGATAGEYSALLVDTARFGVVEHGQFWFSDTPERPGSTSWGNTIPRVAVWARVVDLATGDTVRVYNQHWDHESQPSRERSAAFLLDHIRRGRTANEALLVMGDFNSGEDNAAFRALVGAAGPLLRDSYRAVAPGGTPAGTFNAFRGDSTGDKIDAILASPAWEVVDAGIDRRRFGALWPSDHFPVWAVVRLQPGRR